MDRLDDIDAWYLSLPVEQKLRWRHPAAIVKHCPPQFVKGAMIGHNRPRRSAALRRPAVTAESERLKALLIKVIKRLIQYDPTAVELLDQVQPPALDVDRVDDLFAGTHEDVR
jgi:hypothetical protein